MVEHILTHWKELILWTELPYRFKRLGFQNSFLSIPSTKLVFRIVSTFQCVLEKIFFPRDSFYWLLRKVVDASLNLFSVMWTGLHSFLLYFHQCLITRCLICFWRDLCGIMGLRTLRYVFNGRKNENNSTANDSMKNRFMMNLYLHWKKKLRSRKTAKQSLYLKFMLVIVSRGFTVRLEMAGIYDGLS